MRGASGRNAALPVSGTSRAAADTSGAGREASALDQDEPEELVDLDEEEARAAWAIARNDMLASGSWYLASGVDKGSPTGSAAPRFERSEGRTLLALGRSDFYDGFMAPLERELGERFYQSGSMAWIDLGDPYASLRWYIDSAERIELSLEGIGEDELRRAAIDAAGAAIDRSSLGSRFMTSWEINRIFWDGAVAKTRWHLMALMSRAAALDEFGRRVSESMAVESPEACRRSTGGRSTGGRSTGGQPDGRGEDACSER